MSKSKTQLEIVKTDAESFALEAMQSNQVTAVKKEVDLALGAIGGMRVVSKFTGAATIKILQNIRDEEKYIAYGYSRFDEFLDTDTTAQQYIGISYRTFNKLENQMLNEGDEIYDLLNNFRIPISTRRLLSDGEIKIEVDGDTLQIGEEIINLSEKPDIKQIFKDLARDIKKLSDDKEKNTAKLEEMEEQIKAGAAEFDELRRSLDSELEDSHYERALTKAVSALIRLKAEAENLHIAEIQARGKSDIETLWQQMLPIRKALQQDDFAFIDAEETNKAAEIFGNDDDFGDEDDY